MTKEVLHKICSVALAFLVLFSTLSFKVEKHFCGNHLVDVAIFSKAKKCTSDIPTSCDNKAMRKHCCRDEVKIVKGQDELKLSTFEKPEFHKQLIAIEHAFDYVNLYESFPKKVIPFRDYSPPNLVFDIHVLDQVFLI